jgi:hypothetical protein
MIRAGRLGLLHFGTHEHLKLLYPTYIMPKNNTAPINAIVVGRADAKLCYQVVVDPSFDQIIIFILLL